MLLLWFLDQLAISAIFIALILEWALASLLVVKVYPKLKHLNNNDTVKSIFDEFWVYCLPLIPYAWVGAIYIFSERWMLQSWGGAIEQSYYAIAKQFGVVVFLATSSILNIAWKEVAEAYQKGNIRQVERLYKTISHGLYLVGALIAGYLIPWASEILQLTVGDGYIAGATVFMVMLFYPIHQSMGQVGGMMLYATSRTRLKAILGIVTMFVGITTSYFMMSPIDSVIPGFGMGSKGLALKMVVVQVVEVNLLAWFISRQFNWRFDWSYQVSILAVVFSLGWISKIILVSLVQVSLIFTMIASAIIYFLLIGFVIYFIPRLIGVDQEQLDYLNHQVKKIKINLAKV